MGKDARLFLDPWDWEEVFTDVNHGETAFHIPLLISMNNKREGFIRHTKFPGLPRIDLKVDGQMEIRLSGPRRTGYYIVATVAICTM